MVLGRVEIELESKIESLPVISNFVNDTLIWFQADAATINNVRLAVDEACTNIINYAYSGGTGPLKVVLERNGKDLIIIIQDKGKQFDPTSIPPPDLNPNLEQRKIGGLGIYFIKKLMDNVSYSFDPREGNKLILTKQLSFEASNN
jgi:serine/threonine-protein kinase RsbW